MNRTEKVGYGILVLITVVVMGFIVYSLIPTAEPDARIDLTPEEEQATVTMVLREQDNEFWQTVQMGAEAAAKESGVRLQVSAPADGDDSRGQLQILNKALSDNTDALVIAAVNDLETAKMIANVTVPVIAIDTAIESSRVRSFIGIDNYDAGKKAGQKMAELIDGQGSVFILSSVKDDRNMEQRIQGILDAFKKEPNITVLDNRYCMSGQDACAEETGALMDKTLVRGIVALSADAAVGAAGELISRGEVGRVNVVAFDSANEELELLQEGVLNATIVQNPFSMGYLGVKHAVDALEHSEIPARVDIQTKVIDIENMFWMDNQKLLFPFVK